MEIQISQKSQPQKHQELQNLKPPIKQQPDISQERLILKNSYKSSQSQAEAKSICQRTKNIKKTDRNKRNKIKQNTISNRLHQKKKQLKVQATEIVANQTTPIPITSSQSIYNSLGYTIFTNQIQNYYLTKPQRTHFEKVDKLLEPSHLNIKSLLNQKPAHIHHHMQVAENYIQLVNSIQRLENEQVVLFQTPFRQNQEYFPKQSLLVFYKTKDQQNQSKMTIQNIMRIKNEDLKLLQFRSQFMKKLNKKKQNYLIENGRPPQQISQLSKQILFLNTYLQLNHKHYSSFYNQLSSSLKEELAVAPLTPIQPIQDRLIKLIFQKNINIAMKIQDLDIMNYFKQKACQQQKRDFIPIQNLKKMIQYIKKKRPTKTKKPKYSIYSACTACLSSYCEQTNPLSHCHDCFAKIHKNCRLFLDQDQFCKLCIAKRNRNKKKQFIQCVLCPCKGLTYMKIGNVNVHAFCILVSGKYTVQDQKLKVFPQVLEKPIQSQPCFICCKASHKLFSCVDSEMLCHSTCAFMKGYEMNFKQKLNIFANTLSSQERVRQQFFRKYKLNYDGIVFRIYSLDDYKRLIGGNITQSKNSTSSNKEQQQELDLQSEEEPLFEQD